MRGLRLPVKPDPGHSLHLRLGDMAVQSDIELASQIGAAENEGIRAVMRDGRRDGGAHPVAVEGPVAQRGVRMAARVASAGGRRSSATRSLSGCGNAS